MIDYSHPLPLSGREEEMAKLVSAVDALAAGAGRVFMISGEPGIGKTRLVSEAVARARAAGHLILSGGAYPMEDGLTYSIIGDALSGYLRNLSESDRGQVLMGLDDLQPLVGFGSPASERSHSADAGLAKTRLLDAISRLLERLAASRPLVLALDDIHCADASSLVAVHFLARRLAGQRVLMLVTYRSSPHFSRPLAPLILSLRRLNIVEELRLGRLPRQVIAKMVRAHLALEPPQTLLDLLEERAKGVPLFVETILAQLLHTRRLLRTSAGWLLSSDAGDVLPDRVRDLVLERLDHLGPDKRHLINLLAVGGEPIPVAMLAKVSCLSPAKFQTALGDLEPHDLVSCQPSSALCYAIAHPLIQEVAYGALPDAARRLAHASLISALEAAGAEDVARLARHYRGAVGLVDPQRAIEVLMAAGERARNLHANDAAAHHFTAALNLCGEEPSVLRAHVMERVGEMQDRRGDTAKAIVTLSEARACFQAVGQSAATARVSTMLALTRSDHGDFDAAFDDIQCGLAAIGGAAPSQELADLSHAELSMLTRLGHFTTTNSLARDLAEISRAVDSPQAVAEAHLADAVAQLAQPHYAAVRRSLLLAVQAAERVGEPILLLRARHLLALVALTLGEHSEATSQADAAMAVSRRFESPLLSLGPMASAVEADYVAGRWMRSLERGHAAIELAQRLGRPRVVVWMQAVRSVTRALMGDLEGARAALQAAREALGGSTADRNIGLHVDVAQAIVALEERRPDGALGVMTGLNFDPTTLLPLRLAVAAEAALMADQIEDALGCVSRLNDIDGGRYPKALAARLLGLVAVRNGDSAGAVVELRAAVEGFAAMHIPFEEARTRLELGGVLSSSAKGDELVESFKMFESVGARRYAERARSALREVGIRAPRRAADRSPSHPLTAREREVACMAALGLSNRQVAERLFLSPRTVTTHLSHIYERTGLSSRAALTRYVIENELERHGSP